MATMSPAAQQTSDPERKKRTERRFYSAYLTILAAAIFIGFGPSFFLRGMIEPFAPLRPLRPLVVVHGLITTCWVILFPIQARLIAKGKWQLHRRLGNLGFVLGTAMAGTAYFLAMGIYQEPPPPGLTPAVNVVLPLTDFLTLCVLLPLAWRWRLDAQAHKRLMTIIACLLAGAAIFRMPFADRSTMAGIVQIHLLLFATLIPLWIWDLLTRRRLHRATVIGSAVLFVDMFGRLAIAFTPAWAAFVALLPGFGWP